ncbi:pseudouridine synthase [Facklamia miroungae]|uniref:Pseudouridine synthase n=1 Tax=Facklamia miroungae TaxID=120956 RepID=A0A1G7US93_9LACT|nr:pseudouridine synthase [Facklamia miroungae]NKZ30167.1 rRNA pseudouridine synthase [Facklamia miroungae]SDG49610.1 16S rRNA pseudouridine516 synthase [Facklamia miroungae]
MRIDKLLSHMNFGSRKEVKALISAGSVRINGVQIVKPNFQVDEEKDRVEVEGQAVSYQKFVYWLLNKPKGVVSATEDTRYSTVIDCLHPDDYRFDLFPVGRLDIDTTGLLLITNNGQLAHQLTSPKKKVVKTYQALIQGLVTKETIKTFQEGLDLGDFISQPAQLIIDEIDSENGRSKIRVSISEGKYHQVKRMFQACQLEVMKLHRLSMGPLHLDETLAIGAYRQLTQTEIQALIPYGYE